MRIVLVITTRLWIGWLAIHPQTQEPSQFSP
jgi:hypothetical protein